MIHALARTLPVLALVSVLGLGCDSSVVVGYAVDGGGDAGEPLPEITWPSGMHPGNSYDVYLGYAEWRGRPLDVLHAYVDRRSFQGLVEPGWPLDMLAPFEGQLVLSEPLYPEGSGIDNIDCANGSYDAEWKKLGAFLVDHGRGDAVLRLGWGFNDPLKEWRSDPDPATWIACYRRVVEAIRSTGPDVRFDWTLNSYASSLPASGDPFDAYPGDDYVDIVGTDIYDLDPPSHDDAQWDARCDAPYGICRTFQFARDHGKRAAVGEWGVASCGTAAGGDNPFFVRKMLELFSANDDILAYESYFNEDGGEVCSSIAGGGVNPKASALYEQAYGR